MDSPIRPSKKPGLDVYTMKCGRCSFASDTASYWNIEIEKLKAAYRVMKWKKLQHMI